MTLPAHADVPVGWSEPEAVSPLAFLLVVLGAPVALVLLIAVVVMAPGFTRGEGMTGKGEHDDDQWFGGRKQRVSELDSGGSDPRALPGGASGSW